MRRPLSQTSNMNLNLSFWKEAAEEISWFKTTNEVIDQSRSPFNAWFPNWELNTCYNALDRHIENGYSDKTALIFDSPVSNVIRKYSYGELLDLVQSFSALLVEFGIGKGDRVLIYMPNTPEAAIGMLACSRIGAVHSVVFGGFASHELATRIKDCKPKIILSTSCGIDGAKIIPYKPLLDEALRIAEPEHKVDKCIILQRPKLRTDAIQQGRDYDWEETASLFKGRNAACQAMKSTDPLYILYTSGTTGKPKGILRDTGGHAVALKWSIKNVFGMTPDDVWWAASDVGWVVGHSFIVYAPLLHGMTTVLYEGKPVGTPDAASMWRVAQRHGVSGLFTAPTGLRAMKKLDPDGVLPAQHDLRGLRTLFLAGERADPTTIKWAERALGIPVRDNWWQTETGWPICANLVGVEGYLPIKYGSSFRPCPGYALAVLDDDAQPLPPNSFGRIAIKLPMPPGFMSSLYQNDVRFEEAYMTAIPGYYDTGDAGLVDEDGYVHIMSRTDDVINVAGHRLSTGSMEEVLAEHPAVAEVAVVGIRSSFKGQEPFGLVVVNLSCTKTEEQLAAELVRLVRDRIGPVAAFKRAVVVARLPKTRSGKIMRSTIRSIANHDSYTVPSTCEDFDVVKEIEDIIKKHEDAPLTAP